jgi:hypothetical protein
VTDEVAPDETDVESHPNESEPADSPSVVMQVNRFLSPVFGLCRSFWFNSRIRVPRRETLVADWSAALDSTDTQARRAVAIGRAYDDAVTRGTRVEAKAVGLLQVVAIAFAVVTLVLSRQDIMIRAISLVALLFLIAATWGALEVLRARPRPQALVRTAISGSHGLVETAAAAEQLESLHLYSSNFLAGVVRDLAVGGSIALLALVLVGLGRGDAEPLPPPAQTTTIPTSTTEAGAPGGDHGAVGYIGCQELVGKVALQLGDPRPDKHATPRSPGDRP